MSEHTKTIIMISLALALLPACAVEDEGRSELRAASPEKPHMSESVLHPALHVFTAADRAGAPQPYGEDPAPEFATCTPKVFSVTPATATLNQEQIFKVSGSCLPGSLAAWIAECDQLAVTGVGNVEAQFACTPRWTKGLKSGVIKDKPGGVVLKNFSVLVQ